MKSWLAFMALASGMALAAPARVPDALAFDASETLVVIASNAAKEGSVLSIHDATTGARIATAEFDERTTGLNFCGPKALMVSTETAVHRLDPRTGGHDAVTPLMPGERVAYSARCDFIAIFGPERDGLVLRSLGTGRKFPYESAPGTISACFAGDDSALYYLAGSGALYEVDVKKKKRVPLAAPGGAAPAGLACFGKHGIALGGESVAIRVTPTSAQGARVVDLRCRFDDRSCAVSADGRTLATVRNAAGAPTPEVRFRSTSPMKGLSSVALPKPAHAVALGPSGSDAVVTFDAAPPMLLSRATGRMLPLAPPGPAAPPR